MAYLEPIRAWWSNKTWRIIMIITLVWVALRLIIQIGVTAAVFFPGDLRVYLNAAADFAARAPLYDMGLFQTQDGPYQYAPVFAQVMTAFALLPEVLVALLFMAVHIAAYVYSYIVWDRILRHLGREDIRRITALLLPAWLGFVLFWTDLGLLNIFNILMLLTLLALEDILKGRDRAALWLLLAAFTKPQWLFPLALPFVLGRWKLGLRMTALVVGGYIAVTAASVLAGPRPYIWEQVLAYGQFLQEAVALGPALRVRGVDPALGYNHSIVFTLGYYFGADAAAIGGVIKYALLVPIAGLTLWQTVRSLRGTTPAEPLAWFFLLYVGGLLWLDILWEITLLLPLAAWGLAVAKANRPVRVGIWVLIVIFATADFLRLISATVLWRATEARQIYVADLTVQLPVVLAAYLLFYGVIIAQIAQRQADRLKA